MASFMHQCCLTQKAASTFWITVKRFASKILFLSALQIAKSFISRRFKLGARPVVECAPTDVLLMGYRNQVHVKDLNLSSDRWFAISNMPQDPLLLILAKYKDSLPGSLSISTSPDKSNASDISHNLTWF